MAEAKLAPLPAPDPNAYPLQELGSPPRQPSQGSSFDAQTPENDVEEPLAMLETDQACTLVSITPDEARALNLPELDFKPFMLRPWFLYSSLMFNILILGLMITLIFKPRFRVLSQWGYFFVQIFPAVIGTITASFLHGITMNLSRLAPFMSCAAPSGSTAGRTILREYFPDPSIRDAFEARNFTLIFAWILFILGNFILGLKASLLNTDMTDGYREAIVSTWALYPLIAIYSLVALFMLVVIIRIRAAGSTGLLWDPVSLADHLVLFRHSNILKHFEGTDMATRESMFKVLRETPLKLGYWKWTEGNVTRYWHGFGIPESVENGISVLPSRISQSPVRKLSHRSAQELRYRATYSNMARVSKYIWTTMAFILYELFIAGLYTDIVNGYEIPFSANWAAFLFQFVLTEVVQLFTWFWEDLDLFTRSTQPFMSQKPQPASENLLLDYNCALPYIVTYTALANRHWKVARISALAPLQRLLPILVGGSISVVDNGDGTCTCWASLPLFIIIIVWLFAYTILIPYEIMEAGHKRHLPRNYCSIADILSWTYASKLLNEGDQFDIHLLDENNLAEESDMSSEEQPGILEKRERWYFQAKLQLACKKYMFGMYRSTTRNDVSCMGIDEDSDVIPVSPPDIKELSLLSGMRKRNRRADGGEAGVVERDAFDVSADPRFSFLLDVRAESNIVDANAVPEVRQEGQEEEA